MTLRAVLGSRGMEAVPQFISRLLTCRRHERRRRNALLLIITGDQSAEIRSLRPSEYRAEDFEHSYGAVASERRHQDGDTPGKIKTAEATASPAAIPTVTW